MRRLPWPERIAAAACTLALLAHSSFFPHQPVLPPDWARSPGHASRAPASAAPASVLSWAHSHNDYEHSRPLLEALESRVGSIEADVFYDQGHFQLSHLGYHYAGTLDRLYLDPLQERVHQLGSVYGDGKPLILWIDIKDSHPALIEGLQALLSRYPMLTRFTDRGETPGAITAILTGNSRMKKAYVERFAVRYATRDNLWIDPDARPAGAGAEPGARWLWYTLNWFNHFEWTGVGEPSATEFARLREFVGAIHAQGRKLRFWGNPDTPEFWRTAHLAGVDLVGTDYPEGLRKFAEAQGLDRDAAHPEKVSKTFRGTSP